MLLQTRRLKKKCWKTFLSLAAVSAAGAYVVAAVGIGAGAPKLQKGKHAPRKDLGQNFLSDPNTITKIVDTFVKQSTLRRLPGQGEPPVVELGPGIGALTHQLSEHFPSMIAVEIDARNVDRLVQDVPGLEILNQDLLQLNHSEMALEHGAQLHVIGNLPYCITSDAMLSLVSCPGAIRYALVMLQNEAVDRMVAEAGSDKYGAVSAILQSYARTRRCFKVPSGAFYPKPQVTSAMLELDFIDEAELPEVPHDQLWEVIRTSFTKRKKKLKDSLKLLLMPRRLTLPREFESRRAMDMAPKDFVELTRSLYRSLY